MFFKKKFFIYLFIFTLIPFEILAQESNKVIYNQAYFKQYNITNAADAIKRIPGIENLSSGNNSENFKPDSNNKRRGFGSSGTQILINGERQSSKSNNIIKTLERINANSLIRIEVIRGTEAGLDVRSDGVIVNIIVDGNLSKGSGTWSAALGYLTSGSSNWRGIGSWSTKIKKTDIVLGFERIGDLNSRKFNESTFNQEQSLLYYRLKETIEYQSSNKVNIDLNSKINDKNIIRINTLVWFNGKENAPEIQEYFSPTDIKNEAFYKKINWDRREDNDGWEFGGDWEHQINKNHSLKLRVVLTEENEDQNDISFLNDTEKLYNNSTQGNTACSGNATADLFQGTIKITPKLFNTTTASGDINVLFSIQHRTNSSSSWSSINSVSGAGLDLWTAATSTVQLTKSTASAGNVSKNYRFDQLGEYRVLTNGLGGDQSTHAKFEVEFQDGAYGLTTVGPCQE